MADLQLDTPVQYVKGVGPVRAEQLATLGVVTVEDLLMYFPRRFDLRRQVQPIETLRGDEPNATVAGTVEAVTENRFARRPYFQCTIDDGTGFVVCKWFHASYLSDAIKPGLVLAVSGKVSVYKEALQFIHPMHQVLYDAQGKDLSKDELLPVYPAGGKLTSGIIARIVQKVLPQAGGLVRAWFDEAFLEKRGLMSRGGAVVAMHRPDDKDHWSAARRRCAYDECFLMQLGIAMARLRAVSRPAYPLANTPEIDRRIRARFPFPMTGAQNRVVGEIVADLGGQHPANRLIQGDVGSGKTVVALYAALLAVANGKQAAIMAPTEILAAQHYEKIRAYLAGSRVRTELLVGGQTAALRREVLDGLADSSVNLVVGTHALLGEAVRFANLALVVVDEQHKFGVLQRTTIRGKGFAPHYLVMTATPIPRTLAMTVFGDLDVSTIDELPPGRGQTITRCIDMSQLDEVWPVLARKLDAGQQAYLIYPLVNPSPQLNLTAAQEAYDDLRAGPLKNYRLGLIHGQMPGPAKEQVMADFRAGRVQALVASVVVEVGLDVAAANVMLVMHAERF
ncbi:MAG: ATP-dependent DNA helicase RecG, partial [Planctomycetota bacterium]